MAADTPEQEPEATAKEAVSDGETKAAPEPEQAAPKMEAKQASAEEKPKRARAKRGQAAKADSAAKDEQAEVAQKPKRTTAKQPSAASKPASRAAAASSRTVVRAQARYVRTSARKARMVCGHLRGKSVSEARAILAFTPRAVARDWSKLLESAVANAENNHELVEEDLVVREAYADEGPTIKRFRPRARGRAAPIRKRTSHLTIMLTPGD